MDILVIFIAAILVVSGAGVGVWSILSTRKRYLDDYLRRKRNGTS